MSPAISLVKSLAKPIKSCPYCDHISPADSKFCSACGAALHLMPCPHCGAVNDITTTTACYRCHGELQEEAPPTAPAAQAEPDLPVKETAGPVDTESHARQRPHALVVLVVLMAFAAASYYAYRQRGAIDTTVAVPAAAPTSAQTSAPASAEVKGRINPLETVTSPAAAVPVLPPPAETAATKSTTGADPATPPISAPAAARTSARISGGIRDVNSTATPVSAIPPENSRARADAGKGLERQPPNIGPCTDAVAALGLCTPETTQKRQ